MVRRLLLTLAILGLAGSAAAQAPDDAIIETPGHDAPPARGQSPRVRLFISPMGEPFRGPDGFSAWLAGADADHDGAVTLAEFRADAARFFRLLDTDANGYIDGFEVQAYERDRVPEIGALGIEDGPRRGGGIFGGGERRGGQGGRPGGGRGGGSGRGGGGGSAGGGAQPPGAGGEVGGRQGVGRDGAARYGLLNIPQPVAQADEDWNGRITLIEWDHAATRRFALLDEANAGRLTHDSLRPPLPDKGGKKKP